MLKKITSILCVVIGLIVLVLGITFNAKLEAHETEGATVRYSAADYDLERALFGADFYTYIYNGSDTIVDVLDDINKSAETIVKGENAIIKATEENIKATDALAQTVEKVGKMMIIAVGLLTLAFGINSLGKAFTKPIPCAPAETAVKHTNVPAEETTEQVGSQED